MIDTYDSSSTPLAGQPRRFRGALSDDQLDKIRELFASLSNQPPRPRLRTAHSPTPAGQAIRDLRKRLKLSQDDLAQLLGSKHGQKSISRMESGTVDVSTKTLNKIAEATRTTLRVEFVVKPKSS